GGEVVVQLVVADGEASPLGYVVEASPASGAKVVATAVDLQAELQLLPNTIYDLRAYSLQSGGERGAPGPSHKVRTPGDPPSGVIKSSLDTVSAPNGKSVTVQVSSGDIPEENAPKVALLALDPSTGQEETMSNQGRTLTIGGVQPGVAFTLIAAASGPNNSTAMSNFQDVVPGSLPGQPALSAPVPGDATVALFWSTPTNPTNLALSYTATCRSFGSAGGEELTTSQLNARFTGLTNGVAYACSVAASNAVGTGPASAPRVAVPHEPPRVAQPPALTGMVISVDALSVSVQPAQDGGTSPVTTYTVVAHPLSGGGSAVTVSGPSSPFLLSGLERGTVYNVTATASSAAGTSQPSSAFVAALPVREDSQRRRLQGVQAQGAQGDELLQEMRLQELGAFGDEQNAANFVSDADVDEALEALADVDESKDDESAWRLSTRRLLAAGSSAPLALTLALDSTGAAWASISSPPPAPARQPVSYRITATPTEGGGSPVTVSVQAGDGGKAMNLGPSATYAVSAVGVFASGRTGAPTTVSSLKAAGNAAAPVYPAPEAPTISSASRSGAVATVVVATGDASVTGYSLLAVPDATGVAPVVLHSDSPSFSISSLRPYVTYDIAAYVSSAAGTSPPSDLYTLIDLPPAPILDSAIGGNRQVELAWTLSADVMADIENLVATCQPQTGDEIAASFAAPASSGIVTGLANGVSYDCSVVAVAAGSQSVASNEL
ncbi:hypothetical protein H632_c1864p0, partial [Helicosporidium sp. ATCC 50920]